MRFQYSIEMDGDRIDYEVHSSALPAVAVFDRHGARRTFGFSEEGVTYVPLPEHLEALNTQRADIITITNDGDPPHRFDVRNAPHEIALISSGTFENLCRWGVDAARRHEATPRPERPTEIVVGLTPTSMLRWTPAPDIESSAIINDDTAIVRLPEHFAPIAPFKLSPGTRVIKTDDEILEANDEFSVTLLSSERFDEVLNGDEALAEEPEGDMVEVQIVKSTGRVVAEDTEPEEGPERYLAPRHPDSRGIITLGEKDRFCDVGTSSGEVVVWVEVVDSLVHPLPPVRYALKRVDEIPPEDAAFTKILDDPTGGDGSTSDPKVAVWRLDD